METEKIGVPKIDGWECIGLVIPNDNLPCKFLLFNERNEPYLSDATILNSSHRVCYRKSKPRRVILELSNESGFPAIGEYLRKPDGHYVLTHSKHMICRGEVWRIVEEQS